MTGDDNFQSDNTLYTHIVQQQNMYQKHEYFLCMHKQCVKMMILPDHFISESMT